MANQSVGSRLAGVIGRAIRRSGPRAHAPSQAHAPLRAPASSRARASSPAPARGTAYPGDFLGTPEISYEPIPGNGNVADPGEIVWTWVPFEEDHSQGKDRPVLVIGHDGPWLLALPLTSKDHDHDADQEARAGRRWTDVGSGPWDNRGRASEVRVDRIVRVDPDGVRREGAVLDERRFNTVADAVRNTD